MNYAACTVIRSVTLECESCGHIALPVDFLSDWEPTCTGCGSENMLAHESEQAAPTKTKVVVVDGLGVVFDADGLNKRGESAHDVASHYESEGRGVRVYHRGVCVSETHARPHTIAECPDVDMRGGADRVCTHRAA